MLADGQRSSIAAKEGVYSTVMSRAILQVPAVLAPESQNRVSAVPDDKPGFPAIPAQTRRNGFLFDIHCCFSILFLVA